jgi:uncharacterized membrane protein YdjX (TVP38/TMEM64 family)
VFARHSPARPETDWVAAGLHPVEFTVAGFELNGRRIAVIALVVLACVALGVLSERIDVAAVHAWTEGVNGVLVFALMVVLPLLGFPVTVTHAVAGMRFGLALGLALAALSIVLQLLASYALVRAAPDLFARRLGRLRERLPEGTHGPVTLFTVLLPGVPYFAKNYVLPLIGVPLRTFLLWAAPIHIARSVVGVAFGHFSDDLSPLKIAAFVTYFVAVTLGCAWAFRRVRAQVKDRRPAADGRKSPASGRCAAR